jgi:hypothetical protein
MAKDKPKLPRKLCCEDMKSQLTRKCEYHSYYECGDNVVAYLGKNKYGLMIHDGGSSVYEIIHCPWCGNKFGK